MSLYSDVSLDRKDESDFLKVFHAVSFAIAECRQQVGLRMVRVLPRDVHLIHDSWTATATEHGHPQKVDGFYEWKNKQCYVLNQMAVPWSEGECPVQRILKTRTASVLTHEMVHRGSSGGLRVFSRLLNEGMTDSFAAEIYRQRISRILTTGYSPSYPNEQLMWSHMKCSEPEAIRDIVASYWRGNSEAGREAVVNGFGRKLGTALSNMETSVQEIMNALKHA